MSESQKEKREARLERAIKLRKASGLVRGELLTVEEGAEYSHIEKDSLYYCVNKALIRSFKPPKGKQLIDSADIDDLLRKNMIQAKTAGAN